ncbi:hypothetical protein BC830DRAFT_342835 [Chytriomyces sp. MP71]|nr:hypothetical protein BC830DRAFT_342835 [Chytriomyces sp. MP71]
MSFLPERLPKQQLLPFETFYGFCNTPSDAVILIEACIKGTLRAFDGTRGAPIRSGSVIVFIEKKSGRSTRWTVSSLEATLLPFFDVSLYLNSYVLVRHNQNYFNEQNMTGRRTMEPLACVWTILNIQYPSNEQRS